MRVKVWSGDRKKYLGEGTYEADTVVYFIVMADGSLQSCADATDKPTDIPEGGKLHKSNKDNPMILMDNGDIKYGCQVWWSKINEGPPKVMFDEPNLDELLKQAGEAIDKFPDN